MKFGFSCASGGAVLFLFIVCNSHVKGAPMKTEFPFADDISYDKDTEYNKEQFLPSENLDRRELLRLYDVLQHPQDISQPKEKRFALSIGGFENLDYVASTLGNRMRPRPKPRLSINMKFSNLARMMKAAGK